MDGILFICSEYFTETEEMYEIFCSIVFYIEGLRISNRLNSKFLEKMKEGDVRKK